MANFYAYYSGCSSFIIWRLWPIRPNQGHVFYLPHVGHVYKIPLFFGYCCCSYFSFNLGQIIYFSLEVLELL